MPPKENKKTKALELAISQVDRQFGKGAIMRMVQIILFYQIIVFLQVVYL